ncbi:flagellin [uncultured Roseobacter sp.]|uniref:flagellin n=1 Tax=uncultured Roseobacter sp. TaxID=114847 RepID=UPI0026262036|nr:flagellin [uncultured Roseobacter sp.]
MSSILTNNSAMVALQTLKSINMNLGKVQSEISTGKTVESAKDNAAVWAISKVMESDVAGFNAISDSLALGQATVGVALNGAETITDLLKEVKSKIVTSQEENVDRDKIQADIVALTNQIKSVVGAAQFNGLNMLNEDADVSILASLDRDATGTVTSGEIDIAKQNMTTDKVSIDATSTFAAAGGSAGAAVTAGNTGTKTIAAPAAGGGQAYSLVLTAGAGELAGAEFGIAGTIAAADTVGYVTKEGDTARDVAEGLKAAWDVYKNEQGIDKDVLSFAVVGNDLTVTVGNGDAANTINVAISTSAADGTGDGNVSAGSMAALDAFDVTTEIGAENALDTVEGLINSAIDSAAEFGSTGRQIDTQADFVSKLSDLLTSGIGALVDADMEAASAKLQALQTQQQLGVQALSIANQAPQTILSLFR